MSFLRITERVKSTANAMLFDLFHAGHIMMLKEDPNKTRPKKLTVRATEDERETVYQIQKELKLFVQ